MAHSPISRPDPFAPRDANYASEPAPEGTDLGTTQSLVHWVNTLSECGGGALAADLALDLVLNDIVERARASTGATAAAIALLREGTMVCRATTGENAPDLGVPLDTRSGLSAACVESRQWQRCDDSETDPRVDAELCRRLGVRSILVFPVLKQQELLGIIEIFAPRPWAFGEREIETLQALSLAITESVDHAARLQSAQLAPPEAPETGLESLTAVAGRSRQGDFWTAALSLLVIGLAVTLGWVMGRAGWRRATANSAGQQQVSQAQPANSLPAAEQSTIEPQAQEPESQPTSPAGSDTTPNGLVIYRDGKVVFRSPTQKPQSTVRAIRPAADKGGVTGSSALQVPPAIANGYVVHRVEPEYPDQARAQHIQGTVVLGVLVGKNGAVEKLTTISGDPQLAAAATGAVRQWRFQPFFRDGRPEEFQTEVTVVFRMP